MQTKTIALTGATGFVGRHLLAHLASEGHDLRVLTRSRERNRDLLVMPTVKLIKADVYDADTLTRHFAGCDVAINLVGILNESRRDTFKRAHVELPRLVLGACKAAGVPRLLHMSALKASASDGPSRYLRTKGEAENLLRRESGAEVDVTLFAPSLIFGPGDSSTNRFADILRLPLRVQPLPRANARVAPVYVGDVVDAFARALNDSATANKTYQLCGPQVMSLRELLEKLAALLELKRTIVGMPDSAARLVARVAEWLPGKPFSRDNLLSLSVHSICETSGMSELGITPTSLGSVAPGYLLDRTQRRRLSVFRKRAGR
ncbi:MAG: complex I NDUFA9 subunit family protein [Pseudomonadota bacterium]